MFPSLGLTRSYLRVFFEAYGVLVMPSEATANSSPNAASLLPLGVHCLLDLGFEFFSMRVNGLRVSGFNTLI